MSPRAPLLAALLLAIPSPAAETRPAAQCAIPAPGRPAVDFEAALARARASGRRGIEAAVSLERGNRLAAEGDHAAALESYRESGRLAAEIGEEELALRAGANAARTALDLDRVEGLGAELEALVASGEALGEAAPPLLVHVGESLERLAARDPAARARLRRRAAGAFASAGASGDARTRSRALGHLAALYEQDGRVAEALALTRRALFAALTADAPELLYRWQWQLGRLQRAAGEDALALDAYRRAVATLAELRDVLAFGDGRDDGAFQRELEPIYSGLVDLLLARAGRSDDDAERQALLTEARDAVETLKAAELRDYFRDACLDAQRKAAPDAVPGAVVLYPIALPDRLELIVSRAGRLERFSAPVDRARFEQEVHALRSTLEKRTTRQYLRSARQLYDWLIRPAEAALRGDVEALVVVPGGALRTIPPGALLDREDGRFLIEKVPLAVAPGLTLTDPRAIDREAVQLLAAGISESVQGFAALEAVVEEISAVDRLFPGQTLLNDAFAVERFEREIAERPFEIVHIASHGEFSSDASRSFVLAYDGRLSMDRLAAAVARTRFRRDQPLELLTLSACETAAGDDRAALGLAGIALRSGARSALATLWSVSDEASAQLVAAFYAGLADPALSRAQALQRAQLSLLRTPHLSHPAYWSGFLLISNWL